VSTVHKKKSNSYTKCLQVITNPHAKYEPMVTESGYKVAKRWENVTCRGCIATRGSSTKEWRDTQHGK